MPAPDFKPPEPPSQTALRQGVKKGAEEEKVTGPIEISAVRRSYLGAR